MTGTKAREESHVRAPPTTSRPFAPAWKSCDREGSPVARDDSFEPYRPPLRRGPVTLDERELLRRISDRGPFSR